MRKKFISFLITFFMVFALVIISPGAWSQNGDYSTNNEAEIETEIESYPVKLSGEELFYIDEEVGSLTPEERAISLSKKLENIAKDSEILIDSIVVDHQEETSTIKAGNRVIFTFVEADAIAASLPRRILAEEYLDKIKTAISEYREERGSNYLIRSALYTLGATVILVLILNILNQIFPRIIKFLDGVKHKIPALKIQNLELIPSEQIMEVLIKFIWLNYWLNILGVFYIYFPLVFGWFPWTKPISKTFFNFLFLSLGKLFELGIDYLPNVAIIVVIMIITYYIIRILKTFFSQIEQEKIVFSWFYKEWAQPTYKLAIVLIISFAVVVMVPYLPGFDSPAFQGVSLFLGVLFSLGSTSAISNIIAGIILIYTRAFQVGDRVQIGDCLGNIVEKTLLVTRILTPKNVVITIPNSTVLNSNIINYTANYLQARPPLILHTTITLGYDAPWRKVYDALILAALETEHILKEPAPFVLQTNLNDFYVSYELNAYTDQSTLMEQIYSQLHEQIQDKCNEADIEILSPHYSAIRDGNYTTIPANYLPENYQAPTFKIQSINTSQEHNE